MASARSARVGGAHLGLPRAPTMRALADVSLANPVRTEVDRVVADAFWDRVAGIVRDSGTGLPLLESRGSTLRRWHLLTSEGGVDAVRGRLAPGTAVTVYSRLPEAVDDAALARVAERVRGLTDTSEVIGLIEESGSHMLRFARLSTEDQIATWLRNARSAARATAYTPADEALSLS